MPAARTDRDEKVPLILARIRAGASLTLAAEAEGVPESTAYAWIGTSDEYARAREQRGDYYGQRVADVAQATLQGKHDPEVARVAMDGFKWTASKMYSKAWGDRVQLEGGESGTTVILLGSILPPRPLQADASIVDVERRALPAPKDDAKPTP